MFQGAFKVADVLVEHGADIKVLLEPGSGLGDEVSFFDALRDIVKHEGKYSDAYEQKLGRFEKTAGSEEED